MRMSRMWPVALGGLLIAAQPAWTQEDQPERRAEERIRQERVQPSGAEAEVDRLWQEIGRLEQQVIRLHVQHSGPMSARPGQPQPGAEQPGAEQPGAEPRGREVPQQEEQNGQERREQEEPQPAQRERGESQEVQRETQDQGGLVERAWKQIGDLHNQFVRVEVMQAKQQRGAARPGAAEQEVQRERETTPESRRQPQQPGAEPTERQAAEQEQPGRTAENARLEQLHEEIGRLHRQVLEMEIAAALEGERRTLLRPEIESPERQPEREEREKPNN